MPSVVWIAIAVISVSLPLLTWSVLPRTDRVRQRSSENLRRGFDHQVGSDGSLSLSEPGDGGLAAVARRLTPSGSVRTLDKLLARAGRPPAWPLERLLVGKLVLVAGGAALTVLYAAARPQLLTFMLGGAVTVVLYFLPELLLHSRGQERSQQVALELADTLDQMTIAVEAGLGFDQAMSRAGHNGKGPLAEELVRTLQDIAVGQPRKEAYTALAHRNDVQDLRRFIRAVIQADAYGIAVADVLRTQAAEMRVKRRQRAEEKALQIPVKVIFPLMLCILPVLFIVLLGPAAIDIMGAFSG